MKVIAHFHGRKSGTAGICVNHSTTVEVTGKPTNRSVRQACCDAGYEQVSGVRWRTVDEVRRELDLGYQQ